MGYKFCDFCSICKIIYKIFEKFSFWDFIYRDVDVVSLGWGVGICVDKVF